MKAQERAYQRCVEEDARRKKYWKRVNAYDDRINTTGKVCSSCGKNSVWTKTAEDDKHDEDYEWEECFNCHYSSF